MDPRSNYTYVFHSESDDDKFRRQGRRRRVLVESQPKRRLTEPYYCHYVHCRPVTSSHRASFQKP